MFSRPFPDAPLAIVGGGPMAAYLADRLLARGYRGAILIHEAGPQAGPGMPYDPRQTDPRMLANIAPREIPAIGGLGVLDWAATLDDAALAGFGLARADLHPRVFLPRVMLGAWLRDALARLADRAAGQIELRTGNRVVDLHWDQRGVELVAVSGGRVSRLRHRRAILATGHSWPASDGAGWGRFASPWPSRDLALPDDARVAVLGTSLSGIDVAVSLAHRMGAFHPVRGGGLGWRPAPGRRLEMLLLSRRGLLPEADFYCPLPYARLGICTPEAVAAAAAGGGGVLDRVFALLAAELAAEDPAYAARIGLAGLTADSFAEAYFAERAGRDPFAHARANLAEVTANAARGRTVAWRYALLRLHEVVATVVPRLDATDRLRFDRGLARVFSDCYAAVPTRSIERLLALHDAGALSVGPLRPGTELRPAPHGALLVEPAAGDRPARTRHFTTLIDARGQRRLGLRDLPFPGLVRALLPAAAAGRDRAVPMDDDFALPVPAGASGEVYCLALPYLLDRNPFAQGLTEVAAMADRVALRLAGASGLDAAPATTHLFG